jgi:hypothetical protein
MFRSPTLSEANSQSVCPLTQKSNYLKRFPFLRGGGGRSLHRVLRVLSDEEKRTASLFRVTESDSGGWWIAISHSKNESGASLETSGQTFTTICITPLKRKPSFEKQRRKPGITNNALESLRIRFVYKSWFFKNVTNTTPPTPARTRPTRFHSTDIFKRHHSPSSVKLQCPILRAKCVLKGQW